MEEKSIWVWILFNLFVLVMLAIDLGLFHRKSHQISIKEATVWSIVWISLALAFNVVIYFWLGKVKAIEFITGYLIEKSLSVDNIFVFILIFAYFQVKPEYQRKVLVWGIVGALIMRGIMIGLGAVLLSKWEWIIYIFGGFLVITGIKMAVVKHSELKPDNNPVIKLLRRIFPIAKHDHDGKFFVRYNNQNYITPLFLVLAMIEVTDLIFAVDSIPAIFAVTKDPYIVYTSNVFAILGLRALYFLLAGIIDKFYYLKTGLSVVLVFVGIKMMIQDLFKIDPFISLIIISSILAAAVIASLIKNKTSSNISNIDH